MATEVGGMHSASVDPYPIPGFDLSISELCLALKAKVAKAVDNSRNPSPLFLATCQSAEEDLVTITVMLRRIINQHNSDTHRLPPEILATVASHLDTGKSLVAATQVCYFWRSTLVSYPHLWSHLTFRKGEWGLMFLERSKSVPVYVDLREWDCRPNTVMVSLQRVTDRLIGLEGGYVFLDQLLARPLPMLRSLVIRSFLRSFEDHWPVRSLPSVKYLEFTGRNFPPLHVPNLTNLRFEPEHPRLYHPGLGDDLLDLLRSCPILEVVSFRYGGRNGGIGFTADEATTPIIPLLHLRSFTHESPVTTVPIYLFDKLSLPPTCDVSFSSTPGFSQDYEFPAPSDPFYFSDTRTVRIMADTEGYSYDMLRIDFLNSKGTRISLKSTCDSSSSLAKPLLDFLEKRGTIGSVETLHFNKYSFYPPQNRPVVPDSTESIHRLSGLKRLVLQGCDPVPFLNNPPPPDVWCPGVEELEIHSPPTPRRFRDRTELDVFKLTQIVAASRQKHGTPLKTVKLVFRDVEERLRANNGWVDELRSCVGSLEVLWMNV